MSKCATQKEQRKYLNKLLGNKRLTTILRYQGSRDGWLFKNFHYQCDNKGPSITLFKIENGDCIGGYTKAQWQSDKKYSTDSDAILFNLTQQRVFPTKTTGANIYCNKNYGPCFTGTMFDSELAAAYEPFNGKGHCVSNKGYSGYQIPIDSDNINLLTNQKNGSFTISELEVWEIKFE